MGDATPTTPYPTPQFLPEQGAVEPTRLLADDGALLDGADARMDDDAAAEALELMLFSRAFDEKAFSLHRQGRFGTFSPVRGQEASVVGAALALRPGHDWVVPQYRELPALLHHGLPLERFMLTFVGDPRGGAIPPDVNVLPVQIGLAAQLPHAAGLAWGLATQGSDAVVLAFIGDGGSSEGDFHEACNLAGVVRAPLVVVLQNNGWAISTPRARQSAAATLAARATGYGIAGAVVDGNDLLAVHAVVAAAVERARTGGGPTLVESITYRLGDHNTADDASRYVDAAEREAWAGRDPIERFRRYLAGRGAWDAAREKAAQERIAARIDAAVRHVESLEPPTADALFDHVVAPASLSASPRLARQRRSHRPEGEGTPS